MGTKEKAKRTSRGVREATPPPVISIPEVRHEVTLDNMVGVIIWKKDWEEFIDELEDLRALERFERMEKEPPEAFISLEEMKRRTLANRIKEIRKTKGLTQAALAERLGCTQATVAKFERPDHRPKMTTLDRIAKALDCSVTELI